MASKQDIEDSIKRCLWGKLDNSDNLEANSDFTAVSGNGPEMDVDEKSKQAGTGESMEAGAVGGSSNRKILKAVRRNRNVDTPSKSQTSSESSQSANSQQTRTVVTGQSPNVQTSGHGIQGRPSETVHPPSGQGAVRDKQRQGRSGGMAQSPNKQSAFHGKQRRAGEMAQSGNKSQHRANQPHNRKSPNREVNNRSTLVIGLKGELQPINLVVEELEEEHIFPLKKKPNRFPNAKYFCRLCEYHCDTIGHCTRHIKDDRHLRLKTLKKTELMLKYIPAPCPLHSQSVTTLLDQVCQENGLSDADLHQRLTDFSSLQKLVSDKFPNFKMQLYGSTLNGFALSDSDINVDLTLDTTPLILKDIFMLLRDDKSGVYADVRSDFSAKVPSIYFRLASTDQCWQVSISNSLACQTSNLLAKYSQIDPRVRKLCVIFRHWAKLCLVDKPNEGTLPPYTFGLLIVYFLQQIEPPVLPVLHEIYQNMATIEERNKPAFEYQYFDDINNLGKHWLCENEMTLGELWIRMLQFYTVGFDVNSHVVSIRQHKKLTRPEKKWASKKLAIEDPFSRKRNVGRSVSHGQVYEYIRHRLCDAYLYFAIPQTTNGPLWKDVDSKLLEKKFKESMKQLQESAQRLYSDSKPSQKSENIPQSSPKKPAKKKSGTKADAIVNQHHEAATRKDSATVVKTGDAKSDLNQAPVGNMTNSGNCGIDNGTVLPSDQLAATIKDRAIDLTLVDETATEAKVVDVHNGLDGGNSMNRYLAELSEKVWNSAVGQLDADCKAIHLEQGLNNLSLESTKCDSIQEAVEETVKNSSAEICENDQKECIKVDNSVTAVSSIDGTNNLSSGPGFQIDKSDIYTNKDIPGTDKCQELDLETRHRASEETPAIVNDGANSNDDVIIEGGYESVGSCDMDDSPIPDTKHDQKDTVDSESNAKESECDELFDKSLLLHLVLDDLAFRFDKEILTDGQDPLMVCSICQKEGHLKTNCPDEKLPELSQLPKFTKKYKSILDGVLNALPKDFEPTDKDERKRMDVLMELESYIRQDFPDARLSLFGSSCNGFGFRQSDLDICMVLKDKRTGEDLNYVEVLEIVAWRLKKVRSFFNVFAVTTARVPIVKFKHRRTQLEGDLSLYNILAQHNTRMLQTYSQLDHRVKILGYTMKVFAKMCDVCDASRGSLSSYAYILMVIYYLQQCKPPVLPVLQQLHNGTKPDVIVDGWNAWFFDKLDKLPSTWNDYGKNNSSPAMLWIGLIKFYTEEFNFQDQVISIQQHQMLTKFEKLWNGKCTAIEDPFNLSHNLGSGLSRRMNTYILKAFLKGRELFGTPVVELPAGYISFADYLFDPMLLTDGEPPNDRGCRACGKIGHYAKDCPVVVARKDRKAQARDRRRETPNSPSNHNNNSIQDPAVVTERQFDYRHGSPDTSGQVRWLDMTDYPDRGYNRTPERQHRVSTPQQSSRNSTPPQAARNVSEQERERQRRAGQEIMRMISPQFRQQYAIQGQQQHHQHINSPDRERDRSSQHNIGRKKNRQNENFQRYLAETTSVTINQKDDSRRVQTGDNLPVSEHTQGRMDHPMLDQASGNRKKPHQRGGREVSYQDETHRSRTTPSAQEQQSGKQKSKHQSTYGKMQNQAMQSPRNPGRQSNTGIFVDQQGFPDANHLLGSPVLHGNARIGEPVPRFQYMPNSPSGRDEYQHMQSSPGRHGNSGYSQLAANRQQSNQQAGSPGKLKTMTFERNPQR